MIDNGAIIADRDGNGYKNIQFLGSGGNAQTYHVIRTDDNSEEVAHGVGSNYALKLAHDDLGEERQSRFEKEKEFLREAEHPAILSYQAEGDFSGSPFIIVDYLPNTLEEIILSENISTAEKLNYALQLISALTYLHNLDDPVIHRDIKPSNIFLRQNACYLGDFGLMKRKGTDPDDDTVEVFKESTERAIPYRYPTPDLVDYERERDGLSPKSDVFQLGVVLTELFTGENQNPIKAVERREPLDDLQINEVRNVPGTVASDDIKDTLEEMLREDPEDRPKAEDLLEDWENYLYGVAQEERRLNGRVL